MSDYPRDQQDAVELDDRHRNHVFRRGCTCSCCNHGEGSDCACVCHTEGACSAMYKSPLNDRDWDNVPDKDIDLSLTFAEFSAANRERCESPMGFGHPLNGWSTSDWMVALLGELGEAANVVKKLNRSRDGVRGNKEAEAVLRAKLRKELGDAYVYLDLLCQSLGFYVRDAAVEVFNEKSNEIGYTGKL